MSDDARDDRDDREGDGWPTVSVVVPVRNEAPHLAPAVASILRQRYPRPFDVCLAVAPSDDGTEAIAAELAAREPRVSVVANPAGVTPAALNRAIAATDGDVIVRVDGHAELCDGYVERAVATMLRTGAVNVGGVQAAVGETPFEHAVAAAATSLLGTGGARYRVGGGEGPVDTVYLGVFDRAAGDAVGWFDESLVRNQDYEFNIRLRKAGGTIWFDPELSVSYRPRGSVRTLARQYYQYGSWKADVARRHPDSLKLRQLIPPIAVAGVLVGLLGGRRFPLLRAAPIVYAAAVGATAISGRASASRTALALMVMHTSWAAGFVGQLARPSRIAAT